jgi:hypothetical protein
VISVIAAVCLFQVYVLAGATAPNAVATNPNVTSDANISMLGRLMLAGNESILVNASRAKSGTTILSGSQIQTPEAVEAAVQLGSAGRLHIEPNTNLTVIFDKTSVAVNVVSGSAFVAANPGVTSTVTTPEGTTAGVPGPAPAPASRRTKITLGAVAFIAIIGVAIYYGLNDDSSP